MKIFLASYFQPENHGPGRKIGISPSKPKTEAYGYECPFKYDALSPEDIYWDYHKTKKTSNNDKEIMKQAGETFNELYQKRLDDFFSAIKETSKKEDISVFTLIGLFEGDTLLSWENKGNLSFRTILAKSLRELGYEIQEN